MSPEKVFECTHTHTLKHYFPRLNLTIRTYRLRYLSVISIKIKQILIFGFYSYKWTHDCKSTTQTTIVCVYGEKITCRRRVSVWHNAFYRHPVYVFWWGPSSFCQRSSRGRLLTRPRDRRQCIECVNDSFEWPQSPSTKIKLFEIFYRLNVIKQIISPLPFWKIVHPPVLNYTKKIQWKNRRKIRNQKVNAA